MMKGGDKTEQRWSVCVCVARGIYFIALSCVCVCVFLSVRVGSGLLHINKNDTNSKFLHGQTPTFSVTPFFQVATPPPPPLSLSLSLSLFLSLWLSAISTSTTNQACPKFAHALQD